MDNLAKATEQLTKTDRLSPAIEHQLDIIRERALKQPDRNTKRYHFWQPALAFSLCFCVLMLSNKLTDSLDESVSKQYASEQLYQDLAYLAFNDELEFLTDLEVANWLELESNNDS